jgi:hypothetical protein
MYDGVRHGVQAQGQVEEVANEAIELLRLSETSNASRSPPHVAIIGPPGSG